MRQLTQITLVAISAITITAGNVIAAETAEPTKTAEVIEVKIPDWVTRMKVKGDIRARFEDVQVDGNSSKSRFRERVRIGIYGDVNDQMDWGFRLASGSDESPTSSNQSLDDFSGKRRVWMDLGYFGYTPTELDELHFVIGKIKKPWKGVSDLVWDSDVNPEGVNAQYSAGSFNAQFGYYIMKDNATGSDAQTDVGMTAGQIDGNLKITDGIKLNGGVAGFFYQNIQDTEVVKSDAGKYLGKGNSTREETDADGVVTEYWVNDYEQIDAFISLDIKRGPVPVKIYGEYIVNIAATTPDDDGWRAGVKASFFDKKLGLDYNYRDLGQDAVLAVLTDGDFGGGGTGSKGHKIKAKYEILENCTLGLTALLADNQVNNVAVDTIQADIIVKF
ncbi:MAG: putative porin [Kiritimatiellae bacterium]|nr:putative porin [Kiritimatiellia bacterium]